MVKQFVTRIVDETKLMKVMREVGLETKREFKHAIISFADGKEKSIVVTATAPYIPIEEFKNIFREVGSLVAAYKIGKMIFDKRQLAVFHQPSMEWYFVEWKEQMFHLGLFKHVKILPADEIFRQSVKIGRKKINETYPEGKFHQMSITYADSIAEALSL